jgi:hypothetical protein
VPTLELNALSDARSKMSIKLGVTLPLVDTGGSPGFVRDFAQAAEELGYQGLAATIYQRWPDEP